MKTNQNLTRRMGTFEVVQRTSDGMFNATELLKQWNAHSGQKKVIAHYFENSATDEFMSAIMEEDNLSHRNSVMMKSRANKGLNAGTWMHPILFIDFAMWLNASFKVKVLKFVYDELIKYRCEAGDAYRYMTSQIAKIVHPNHLTSSIMSVAKALNYIVYGKHEPDIRNTSTEVTARELFEREKEIAKLIENGFIKDYDHLINFLRREWDKKQTPKSLQLN